MKPASSGEIMTEIAKVVKLIDPDALDVEDINQRLRRINKEFNGRDQLDPYVEILTRLGFVVINSVTLAYSKINFLSLEDCEDLNRWPVPAAHMVARRIYNNVVNRKDTDPPLTDTQIVPWCLRWTSCVACTYAKRNGVCSSLGSVIQNILSASGCDYKQLVEMPEIISDIKGFLKQPLIEGLLK